MPSRAERRRWDATWRQQAQKARPFIASRVAELRGNATATALESKAIIAGWSVILTVHEAPDRELQDEIVQTWSQMIPLTATTLPDWQEPRPGLKWLHMSARPHPIGRGTCQEDWHNLGEITGRVGMPKAAADRAEAQLKDDVHVANRAIHWVWYEEHAAQPATAGADRVTMEA